MKMISNGIRRMSFFRIMEERRELKEKEEREKRRERRERRDEDIVRGRNGERNGEIGGERWRAVARTVVILVVARSSSS